MCICPPPQAEIQRFCYRAKLRWSSRTQVFCWCDLGSVIVAQRIFPKFWTTHPLSLTSSHPPWVTAVLCWLPHWERDTTCISLQVMKLIGKGKRDTLRPLADIAIIRLYWAKQHQLNDQIYISRPCPWPKPIAGNHFYILGHNYQPIKFLS